MEKYVGVNEELLKKLNGCILYNDYTYVYDKEKKEYKFVRKIVTFKNGFLVTNNDESDNVAYDDSNRELVKEFFTKMGIKCSHPKVLSHVGNMSFDEFDTYCRHLAENREIRRQKDGITGIVLDRVTTPKIMFRRESANENTKTFDFINAEISICISDYNEAMSFCKSNYRKLVEFAIDKIKNSKRFINYGIPVGYLRIDNVTLTKQKVLNILFSLKEA